MSTSPSPTLKRKRSEMAALREITFVTGNADKLRELRTILEGVVNVVNKKIDLPELQGEVEDIIREKCKLAAAEVKGPVLVEDTNLCFNALGGLPGPYIKWFLDKLGYDGLNKMLYAYEDKSASAVCAIAYAANEGEEPVVVIGKTPGKIVPARGDNKFGWDPIFQPDGFEETYAEMDSTSKNSISHRRRALNLLLEELKKDQKEDEA